MTQVLVLVGPTAVGKSSYGIELAKRLAGEIISGDSIQVYRGLNIGSGKCTVQEMEAIPHHLIDILNSRDRYSVADFQREARRCIEKISQRGHLPILVGGTGLYIKACLYDYEFLPEGVSDLQRWEKLSNDELVQRLRKLDPAALEKIHPNNRKRLIRALVLASSGETKSEREAKQQHQPVFDALILGLTCQRETLARRIDARVEGMLAQGLQKEVAGLLNAGVLFSDQAMQGIGYREWQPYFEGKATIEEVAEAIKTHSRQFAKRQYTWFHHQLSITWLNIEENGWKQQGLHRIEEWRKTDG